MRLGILTDIHANLPALETALEAFRQANCERVFHVGDLIGIGPFPKECMELAFSQKNLTCIMGNHDYWYAHGLSESTLKWMSPEEVDHQRWTHSQLGTEFRDAILQWSFEYHTIFENHKLSFQHYGLNEEKKWFKSIIKNPSIEQMDELFDYPKSDLLFYGHHHVNSDLVGQTRYLNPGSAGCYDRAEVRLYVLDLKPTDYSLYHLAIPYEDDHLLAAFEDRKVPARDFIRKVFVVR